jgi:hypothetical protein
MRRTLMAAAVTLAGLAGGCNSGGGLIDIEGTVTVNGKDVKEGDITFAPEDKKFGGQGGKIIDGRFKMKARAGKNTVTFVASEETGKKVPSAAGPGAPAEAERQSIIPAKYEKGIEETVGPDRRTFTFALTK